MSNNYRNLIKDFHILLDKNNYFFLVFYYIYFEIDYIIGSKIFFSKRKRIEIIINCFLDYSVIKLEFRIKKFI